MKGYKHLSLLGIAHALYCADQPRPLRHEKLLMIVRVVVGGEHDQNRAAQPTVNMVGDNPFKYCSLEDAIKTALIVIEVVSCHRVGLGHSFGLLNGGHLHNTGLVARASGRWTAGSFRGRLGMCLLTLPQYSRCRLRRDGGTGTGRCARVGEVDSDRIATDSVLRL